MKYAATLLIGFVAAAAAQSSAVQYTCAPGSASDCSPVTSDATPSSTAAAAASSAATDCVTQYNTCRQPTNGVSANQAFCSSQNAQCQGTCQTAYDTCRQPTNGMSANQAACSAAYAGCLGESPSASSSATSTAVSTAAAAASATASDCVTKDNTCRQPTNGMSANQAACASQNAQCEGDCKTAYDTCRQPTNGMSANQAACSAAYAGCLGKNPFSNSTTSSSASAYVGPAVIATGIDPAASVVVTSVVTSFTTYCPAATTLTFNNKVYTVSSATTLTITDCPCTITSSATASLVTATHTGNSTKPATPSSTLEVFTGGAAREVMGASSVFAAVGSFFLFFL